MSLWRREVIELRLACVPESRGGDDAPAAARAVAALAARLDARPFKRGTRVACIVPGQLARYLIVPWNAAMQKPASRQVFAEHCFRETYAEMSDGWVVRVDEPAYERSSLACAIDGALLDALAAMLAERGLVPCSIQPALMHAANALETPLSPGLDWIVVPDGAGVTLLLMEGGRPLWVSTAAAHAGTVEAVLAREWFAIGRDPAPAKVHVCAPAVPS